MRLDIVQRLGYGDGKGEGAVEVAPLLLIGAHAVAAELGEGLVRGRKQLRHADAIARRLADDETLGQGQAHEVAAGGEGRGYFMTAVFGQKIQGRGEYVVVLAALDDDALRGGDAVVFQDCLKVCQFRAVLERGGQEDEPAPGLEVFQDGVLLGFGYVAGGGVYQQAVRVLRHTVGGEQGETLNVDVLLFNGGGERGRELRLPVAAESVEQRQILARDVVDGAGELALAGEADVVAAGGIIAAVVVLIEVRIADICSASCQGFRAPGSFW